MSVTTETLLNQLMAECGDTSPVRRVCHLVTDFEAERDALREALIQIDHHASQNRVWAGVDGWKYAGLSNVAQKKIHGITQAALATEVTP